MITWTVLEEDIWICDRDEANRLAREYPADRFRLWLFDEVSRWLLGSPEDIAAVMSRKKARPGPYMN